MKIILAVFLAFTVLNGFAWQPPVERIVDCPITVEIRNEEDPFTMTVYNRLNLRAVWLDGVKLAQSDPRATGYNTQTLTVKDYGGAVIWVEWGCAGWAWLPIVSAP